MNKTKFLQTDSRWGGLGYPKKPWYIRNCGCGEVSIANIIIEIAKYKSYTPATIQPYCKQFAAPNGDGTYFSGIPKMMKHYGLTEVKEHDTMAQLWRELEKGDRVAIYLMGSRPGGSKKVHWTSGGHFVCSVGYKVENGKHYVYVKDSYSNSKLRNGFISYEENMRNDVLRVWSGKLPKAEPAPTPTKSLDEIAREVIDGKWGNGDARVDALRAAGYDPSEVQNKVNEIIASRKSVDELAQEVLAGKWGTGDERKKRLTDAGYDYDAVQKRVNELLPKETWVDKANAWAKKIAADNSYHYVKWTSKDAKTHECPICHNHPKGKYHGWNCIGFAFAVWHHGGGLPCKCSDGVIANKIWENILNAKTDAEALAIARKHVGLKDLEIIRNKKGVPKSQWKAGDILGQFKNGKYFHTMYYMGNGQIAESTGASGKTPVNNQIRIKPYSNKSACVIVRYVGK